MQINQVLGGVFIDRGKLSLTGTEKIYILGDKLGILLEIFHFKISNIISHFIKYRQDFLEKESLNYIPDIRKLNINDITETDFYKMLKLTEEEIDLVNKYGK